MTGWGNKTKVQFPDGTTQRWEGFNAFGQPGLSFDERSNPTHVYYWPWGPMKKLQRVITHRDRDGGGTEDQHTVFYPHRMGRPWRIEFPDGTFEQTDYDNEQEQEGSVLFSCIWTRKKAGSV